MPSSKLVRIYTKEIIGLVCKDVCSMKFSGALVVIIPINWKQPKHPSVGEWFNKFWYVYTLEYHIAVKKDKVRTPR